MTEYDGEDFVEDTQQYIEGRFETGSQQSLDEYNRRLEHLSRDIRELERQLIEHGPSDELDRRLTRARSDLDALRARGKL